LTVEDLAASATILIKNLWIFIVCFTRKTDIYLKKIESC
jgi:hypothetical protein